MILLRKKYINDPMEMDSTQKMVDNVPLVDKFVQSKMWKWNPCSNWIALNQHIIHSTAMHAQLSIKQYIVYLNKIWEKINSEKEQLYNLKEPWYLQCLKKKGKHWCCTCTRKIGAVVDLTIHWKLQEMCGGEFRGKMSACCLVEGIKFAWGSARISDVAMNRLQSFLWGGKMSEQTWKPPVPGETTSYGSSIKLKQEQW